MSATMKPMSAKSFALLASMLFFASADDFIAKTDSTHQPLKIHLERVKAHGDSGATFYVGKLAVGQPAQEFKVLFDTSSGHVLLPHLACKSKACIEHKRFSPGASSTAMDVNVDGTAVDKGHRFARHGLVRTGVAIDFTQADLGEGQAKTVVVRDNVCIEGDKGDACVNLETVTAVEMQDVPFRAMPNDGILGLGMQALAAGPLLNFMGVLMDGSKTVLPQFGISFGSDGGDLYLGGQHPALSSPIQWLPVNHPEGGYWQVDIKSVRVGGKTIDTCKRGCHGIIDSGTSHLGVQSYRLPLLRAAIDTQLHPTAGCGGPSLEFDLGVMVINLEAEDYSDENCKFAVGSLNLEEPAFVGVYAFGESVLRRYYAAFDWENKKVGFAPNPAAPAATVVV